MSKFFAYVGNQWDESERVGAFDNLEAAFVYFKANPPKANNGFVRQSGSPNTHNYFEHFTYYGLQREIERGWYLVNDNADLLKTIVVETQRQRRVDIADNKETWVDV